MAGLAIEFQRRVELQDGDVVVDREGVVTLVHSGSRNLDDLALLSVLHLKWVVCPGDHLEPVVALDAMGSRYDVGFI